MASAEAFGTVIYMTQGPVNRTAAPDHARTMRGFMKHSRPDDYIVVGGLSVLTAVAASLFSARHGKLNLLIWERGKYVERIVRDVLPS